MVAARRLEFSAALGLAFLASSAGAAREFCGRRGFDYGDDSLIEKYWIRPLVAGEVADPRDCQADCDGKYECKAWSMDLRESECRLHREGAELFSISDPLVVAGPKECGAVQCLEEGWGYKPLGGGHTNVTRTLDDKQCARLCRTQELCDVWQWMPASEVIIEPKGAAPVVDEAGEERLRILRRSRRTKRTKRSFINRARTTTTTTTTTIDSNLGKCQLISGPVARVRFGGAVVSGPKRVPVDHCFERGIAYEGGEVIMLPGRPFDQDTTGTLYMYSANECSVQCKGTKDCDYWEFVDGMKCRLIHHGSSRVGRKVARMDTVSGEKWCVVLPEVLFGETVRGFRLDSLSTVTDQQCGDSCAANSACTAYSFSTHPTMQEEGKKACTLTTGARRGSGFQANQRVSGFSYCVAP